MANNPLEPKSTNGLMKHLREKSQNKVDISGSKHKQELLVYGFYHGYKGYRFYRRAKHKIPFNNFSEIVSTIKYDTELKALLYPKVMFIETAIKNVSLQRILEITKSSNIDKIYEFVISDYNSVPRSYRDIAQKNKLKLQKTIQENLMIAYNQDNSIITHFYNSNKYKEVPLWALFEILDLGDFAQLLSCLSPQVRIEICKDIGMTALRKDKHCLFIYEYICVLKSLRNAIAHNNVVYDARFRHDDKVVNEKVVDQYSRAEEHFNTVIHCKNINFKCITDYIALICYFLIAFKVSKTEINKFIRNFEDITSHYRDSINEDVAFYTIDRKFEQRLAQIKNFVKSY